MGSATFTRQFLTVLLSGALLIFGGTRASAEKLAVQVIAPAFAEESGFSVRVTRQDSGELAFRITRDLSKARSFSPDSELMTRRTGTLNVFGSNGRLATCEVAADPDEKQVTYRFTVTEACVPHSHFTLAEIDDYKDQQRERLIGGGAFYKVNLADFAQLSSLPGKKP
jgi:hypothetical protein